MVGVFSSRLTGTVSNWLGGVTLTLSKIVTPFVDVFYQAIICHKNIPT